MENEQADAGGTADEPVSRDQILRRVRGQGNIHFRCSADHEQDWQPYPVDPHLFIFTLLYVMTILLTLCYHLGTQINPIKSVYPYSLDYVPTQTFWQISYIHTDCGWVLRRIRCTNEQRAGGGGGERCQIFFFFFFPCSADHERDWPPCKVAFFGLATNALR